MMHLNYEKEVLTHKLRNKSYKPEVLSNEIYEAKCLKCQVWNKNSETKSMEI